MFEYNEEYHGWSNKPTYHYSEDVFNNSLSFCYWSTRACQFRKYDDGIYRLASELKEYIMSESREVPHFCELMMDSVEKINFNEVAERLMTMCDETSPTIQ